MENFLSTVTGIVISIGTVFAIVVVGGLYLLGIIKGKKDNEDDRLITILKETVDALEKKVDDQKREYDTIVTSLSTKIDTLTTKVQKLEEENETLVKVLQGRDEQTQLFYKEAFKAFELVETMNKNQADFLKLLSEHFKITI